MTAPATDNAHPAAPPHDALPADVGDPRFQLADAFIITTSVAVTFAVATVFAPSGAMARLAAAVLLLPAALGVSGLLCFVRCRRGPESSAEYIILIVMLFYALAFVLLLTNSLIRLAPIVVQTISVATLFCAGVALFAIAGMTLYAIVRPKRHQSWLHWYGVVVGLAMLAPFALLFVQLAFLVART